MNSYVTRFLNNETGKDFVVGDLHGRFDVLLKALDEVGFNFKKDRLFSVGDLIDRGAQNRQVVELLKQPWFFAVRGNHDQFVIDQFDEERVQLWRYREYTSQEVHFNLEGKWFFELSRDDQVWFYGQLKHLPYLMEIETDQGVVGICHAGLPRYIDDWDDLKSQLHDRDIREQVLRTRRAPKQKRVITNIDITIHGHTCFDLIHSIGNSYWIDTFDKTGRLTVVELTALFGRPECL